MKVVRGGSAAFGPVVKDRPAGTEVGKQPEKSTDLFEDGLGAVLYMGDSEVSGENRAGIAEDQVFPPVKNPFLAFREVIQTEETPRPVCICILDVGKGVLDSFRIVLETDGKSSAGDIPLPDIPERFAPTPEIRPRLFLLGQQVETESRKLLSPFPAVESGKGLPLKNGREVLFLLGSDDPPHAAFHLS
jgi:hypothetical protein